MSELIHAHWVQCSRVLDAAILFLSVSFFLRRAGFDGESPSYNFLRSHIPRYSSAIPRAAIQIREDLYDAPGCCKSNDEIISRLSCATFERISITTRANPLNNYRLYLAATITNLPVFSMYLWDKFIFSSHAISRTISLLLLLSRLLAALRIEYGMLSIIREGSRGYWDSTSDLMRIWVIDVNV